MDGWKLIREAYERGYTSAQVYKPYNTLFSALRRFVDPDYFGVLGWSEDDGAYVPMHVNSDRNPKPCRDYFGRRCRRLFKKSDLVCHLAAEPIDPAPQFRFLVNGAKQPYALICLDIDGDDVQKTKSITSDVYEAYFVGYDYGGDVFIERSRNRRGHYIYVVVERSSHPEEFNWLCNALSGAIRSRHQGDGTNRFDAIKATCHFDDRNDLDKLFAEADGDVNDNHRGLLATMPLSGVLARPNPVPEINGFLSFVKRVKGRYVHSIPESHLRCLLEAFDGVGLCTLDDRVAERRRRIAEDEAAKRLPAAASSLGNNLRMNGQRSDHQEARAKLVAKITTTISGKNRMRFASSLFFYENDRYATDEHELVAFYKKNGFNRDPDPAKDKVRLRRAADVLADHKNNRATPKYKPEKWLQLIERYVTTEVRSHPSIRYRSRRTGKPLHVEPELLAAGLYLFTQNAFSPNRIDRMHSCSQEAQLAWYTCLSEKNVLAAAYADKPKRVAVVKMLQLSGLTVLRDGNHRFGGRDNGVGDKFGLGVNHPRFNEFIQQFGHVVDPKAERYVIEVASDGRSSGTNG